MEKEITLEEFTKTFIGHDKNPESFIVDYYGFKMKGMISSNYDYQLWTKDGGTTIYYWQGKLNKEELIRIIEAIRDGKKVCSGCHKIISDKPNYYFAGVYCDECFYGKGIDKDRDWAYSHLD